MKAGWQAVAEETKLDISISGLDALANFTFAGTYQLQRKTYMTQEMLKRGWLATPIFYASTAHTTELIDDYLSDLRQVFHVLASRDPECQIDDLLDGPECHSGFQRLN